MHAILHEVGILYVCIVLSGAPVSCPPHLFSCRSSECVDPSQLCNGVTNCLDASDEGEDCLKEKCSQECAQDCHATPTGPVQIYFKCFNLKLCSSLL